MLDKSHSPIGPYGPLGQSPSGDNFRHASAALLSACLDCGKNAGVGRDGVGCRGEAVGLSSKFWDSYKKVRMRQFGFERDCVRAFAHVPPLQEFCDMLARITRNRIQSLDDKRICACSCIALVVCSARVSICISLRARERERERERGKHARGRVDNVVSIAAIKGWIGWNDRPFALPFPPDPAPRISPSLLHAFGLGNSPIMMITLFTKKRLKCAIYL